MRTSPRIRPEAALVGCLLLVLLVLLVPGLVLAGGPASLAPPPAAGAEAVLSGAVTDPAGSPVAGATISAKNLATGRIAETRSDAAGHYTLSGLDPGDYEVSVSSGRLGNAVARATLTPGAARSVKLVLASPAGAPPAPSLEELGFTPGEIAGNAQDQARLDRRSRMLKIHQRLGLITAASMLATVIASGNAGEKHGTSTGRDVHGALGLLTAGLYSATAYYALAAPKIPGTETRGQIRFHKILAWVHGTGMVLTPILGLMAYEQIRHGEKVHGIARAHSAVADVTLAAYGLSILSVSVKF